MLMYATARACLCECVCMSVSFDDNKCPRVQLADSVVCGQQDSSAN